MSGDVSTFNPVPEEKVPVEFTAADRCDRCGAQAKVRATLSTGTLEFCKHHGVEYLPGLAQAGAKMEGEPL